jgi:hypothetical protein
MRRLSRYAFTTQFLRMEHEEDRAKKTMLDFFVKKKELE